MIGLTLGGEEKGRRGGEETSLRFKAPSLPSHKGIQSELQIFL
jgi:hypothetical protein